MQFSSYSSIRQGVGVARGLGELGGDKARSSCREGRGRVTPNFFFLCTHQVYLCDENSGVRGGSVAVSPLSLTFLLYLLSVCMK